MNCSGTMKPFFEGETDQPGGCGSNAQFTTTHWSVVLAARDTASRQADAALAELCRTYWYPLYAFVRRKGHRPHDAQDLTQAFFARLLEKNYVAQADRERGRFRTYLLAALTHFLADEWDKTRRLKRGGGREIISFDAASAEERYRLEPIDQFDAAKLYERRWVTTLFDKVLARFEEEFRDSGKGRVFDRLKNSLLADTGGPSYAEWARTEPQRKRRETNRPSDAPPLPRIVPRGNRTDRGGTRRSRGRVEAPLRRAERLTLTEDEFEQEVTEKTETQEVGTK